ncbi:hypothetical protein CBER1_11524 [Cercospora berteroae]|uniref:Uncharacterized protein n=1 Tax=Cercospora berteroae TaxID=357750 RepID=A0A2S6CGZ1_9PEZI|nr:hypothetical protein CBER1_11524 [Cercospora berteroae]
MNEKAQVWAKVIDPTLVTEAMREGIAKETETTAIAHFNKSLDLFDLFEDTGRDYVNTQATSWKHPTWALSSDDDFPYVVALSTLAIENRYKALSVAQRSEVNKCVPAAAVTKKDALKTHGKAGKDEAKSVKAAKSAKASKGNKAKKSKAIVDEAKDGNFDIDIGSAEDWV